MCSAAINMFRKCSVIKGLPAGLFACVVLFAQAPEHRTLTLVTGRGELLQFTSDVKQVAAAEPKIADVVVISPREVMVNAKDPGKTTW